MKRQEVFNFAAGPSTMPQSVLEKAAAELLNYNGSGMSVMEMSHRTAAFQEIFDRAKDIFRRLLQIPDSHEILLLQGGATTQFAAIAMNLLAGGEADYAVTGRFSGRAAEEAKKYGTVHLACDTASTGHDRIPKQEELKLSDGAKYFYYCANNTIYGTEWQYVPETACPLVCDMSSDILTRPVDFSKYALVYAGAQKNMAPAGLTVVVVRKDLAGHELPCTPEMLSYDVMIRTDSMLNTPPCWCIYMFSLVLDWVSGMGGVAAMRERAIARAGLLYDVLDESRLFIPHARKDSRSLMNVTFSTGKKDLDALFVAGAAERGLLGVKGHKSAGGMRASLYNAMPLEGAAKLAEYMREFEAEHV
ncbi:MAG: 3-phosphoserine/phosphohydroxythreonine transaminase [Oscillospiraceae bacterium]|nr:3-phosphoserine/phosphohydroxythreonine transaminase [Oscillospiraceae bacterium]